MSHWLFISLNEDSFFFADASSVLMESSSFFMFSSKTAEPLLISWFTSFRPFWYWASVVSAWESCFFFWEIAFSFLFSAPSSSESSLLRTSTFSLYVSVCFCRYFCLSVSFSMAVVLSSQAIFARLNSSRLPCTASEICFRLF